MSDAPILSFNAGCADYDENTNQVTPWAGTGKITVIHDPEEAYLHFSWAPRDGFEPPEGYPKLDTYALIPGDAQWKHVTQCTTGRIFALKFQSSDQRKFFWMQSRTDASDKKPGSLSSQDKKILSSFATLLSEDSLNTSDDEEEEEVSVVTASTDNHVSQPNDLSALLRSVTLPNTPPASTPSSSVPIVNLSDALPQSLLIKHVNSLSDEALKPLIDHLPAETPKTKAELIRVLQSSQFAQGTDTFSNVLMQGGLGPIVAHELDFPYTGEGIEGFLSGIRKAANPGKKPKEDDSDEMDIE